MRYILLTIFLLIFLSFTKAQVKTNFNNHEVITVLGKFQKAFQPKGPYIIPAKDIKAH